MLLRLTAAGCEIEQVPCADVPEHCLQARLRPCSTEANRRRLLWPLFQRTRLRGGLGQPAVAKACHLPADGPFADAESHE
jgi:hypothetical protein